MTVLWALVLVAASPEPPSDAYQAFRASNAAFARDACHALEPLLDRIPIVDLHGDAHVEQFVVTNTMAGLSDFDDAARGPAALDYVRFLASLEVAGRQRGDDPATRRRAARAFASAYWTGKQASLPRLVSVLRAGFVEPPERRVQRLDAYLRPVEAAKRARIRSELEAQLRHIERGEGDPAGFMRIIRLGQLQIGVGSRFRRKYLARVRGPTDSETDDEFLEIKELTDLSMIPCLDHAGTKTRSRVQRSIRALGVEPERGLGVVELDGVLYWTHLWARHYWELDVRSVTAKELIAISASAGAQLRAGHRRSAPTADFGPMRRLDPLLRALAVQMAADVVEGWRGN